MAMRHSYPNGPMSGYNQEQYYEERPPYNNYGPNRLPGGYNAGLGVDVGLDVGYGKPHGVSSYPGSNTYGGQGLGYGSMGTAVPYSQHGHHAASDAYLGGYRGTTLTRKTRYRRQGKAHSCKHSADDSCSSDSSSDSDNEHHGRRRSYY